MLTINVLSVEATSGNEAAALVMRDDGRGVEVRLGSGEEKIEVHSGSLSSRVRAHSCFVSCASDMELETRDLGVCSSRGQQALALHPKQPT